MIIGIGTDVVQITRIESLLEQYGYALIERILSEAEKMRLSSLAAGLHANFLAKRFAAKEATGKALGTGIGSIGFKDITISNDETGKPYVEIDFQKFNLPAYNIDISLADDHPVALAFVIISLPVNK